MRGSRIIAVLSLLITCVVVFAPTPVLAVAFLNDWFFDTSATGGTKTQINEFLDITGTSYIITNCPATGACNGTFTEYIALRAAGHDGGASLGLGNGEVTALGTLNGNVTTSPSGGIVKFTGGVLNVYADTAADFATTTGIYGANNGTLIGSFSVIDSGQVSDGNVNALGVPNGEFTLISQATFLAPGFWLDAAMTNLLPGVTFGFTTTNASVVSNPSANVLSEIVTQFAGGNPNAPGFNIPPTNFIVSDNGQERLATAPIPEPSTLLLFGGSLLGLGLRGWRRHKKA